MPDISALGAMKPVQLDLGSGYKAVKESTFRLAPKGVYVLQAPESFPTEAFGRTKNGTGDLTVQIDPKILGPTNEGFQMRFIRVSAKTYERDGGLVSQLGDYLISCGVTGPVEDEGDLANLAEQTANLNFRAKLDWNAYFKSKVDGTEFKVRGMEKFPKNPDGTYQSWINHPTEKDEEGDPIRVRANLYIDRFLPAIS